MSDFALRRESIEILPDYDILESKFENGARQARLVNDEMIGGFRITTPDLTETQMQEYFDHFKSKYGSLTEFTFTSPFDSIEYYVTYVPQSVKVTYKSGYFKASFDFRIERAA